MLEAARPPLAPLSTMTREPEPAGGAGLSLHALLDVVRRRWLALFLCLAATLAAAAVYVSITPKRYAATATLLIDLRLAQLSQTETSGTVVDQAAVESQIELLRSEKMLVTVMKKRNLLDDPEFGGRTGKEAAPASGGADAADIAERRVIATLAGNLWVARVGRSYLVNVTYSSPDPVKAAQIANDVVEAYTADQVDAKIQTAKDQNAWLDAQVNERRSRAAQAYRAVQDFKGSHTINPLGDLGISREIDKLAPDATRARAAVITARARLDRVDELLASPAHTAGTLPPAELSRGLDDAEAVRLAGQADAPSPGAEGATPGASEAAPAFWTRVAALADARRDEWLTASTRQQDVDARLAELRLTDTRNRLLQERLRELETEAATSRSLYESYLNQLTHAAQQQPVPASDTRMISPAAIPLFPSAPRKMLTLALAAVAGSALGLIAMFVLENLDDLVRTRAQLERITGLPCIGLVPRIRRWHRRNGKVRPLSLRLREGFPGLAGFGPTSRARDVLRGLQFAALNGARDPGAPALGVTSAVPREGKTTIALNLAVSASQSGRRVLLVDCNLRSPTLTRLVLQDGAAIAPGFGLRHSVRAEDGFDVLPASAQGTIEGAETPDTDLFRSLLAEARSTYDLVIVDLPAILPLSEVRSLVHQLDMVVLVTRWGVTTASQVERALARFADVDHLIGVVLNGIRPRTMRRFEGSTHRAYADRL